MTSWLKILGAQSVAWAGAGLCGLPSIDAQTTLASMAVSGINQRLRAGSDISAQTPAPVNILRTHIRMYHLSGLSSAAATFYEYPQAPITQNPDSPSSKHALNGWTVNGEARRISMSEFTVYSDFGKWRLSRGCINEARLVQQTHARITTAQVGEAAAQDYVQQHKSWTS